MAQRARSARRIHSTTFAVAMILILAGCSTSETPPEAIAADSIPDEVEVEERAPWSNPPLSWAEVPEPYREAWEGAENRESCAPVAPERPLSGGLATVRTAEFGGGWGVAYDLPEQRSAFGVAGTGASAAGPTYDGFPFTLEWTDGSSASYGLEGGTGPNQLAYLRIPGQECLYNVWSAVGKDHLEELLGLLRFVDSDSVAEPSP